MAQRLSYPQAPRLDVLDVLHGQPVADPYRWLEDNGSAETGAWNHAQDDLARVYLDALPGRDHLRRRFRELIVGYVGLPVPRGDRVFFSSRLPEQEHAVLHVREPDGTERALIDPSALSADQTVTLDMWSPSHDGRLLAYKLSEGGNEETTIYVMDVTTGDVVDEPIVRTRAGSFAWLPDATGFYYGRRLPRDAVPSGEEQYHRRVWLRQIGSADDELVFGEGRDKTEFHGVSVSLDGRWLIISATRGNAPFNDLYIADLHGDRAFRPIVEGVEASTFGYVADDDGRLYLRTNLDASMRRIVVADPANPEPGRWTDLITSDERVLAGAVLTRDAIVCFWTQHAVGQISVHDRDGAHRHDVKLPGLGTVAGDSHKLRIADRDEVWFAYADFVTPAHVYRYAISDDALEVWASPPGTVSTPTIDARQVFVTSKDGTHVPMFVLRRKDVDGERPTILHGYGGWAISVLPSYSAAALAWVEAGGVWASANIRGGSEYGEAWHRAGMRETKQNVFDDFIAAGEWLCANGITSPDRLSIQGGSNGGILMGAMITQRPGLFRAVVCSAPVLDMIRYPHMPGGQIAKLELGDPDKPDEFAYLIAYSPYHHVAPDTEYPAVLFTVFEGDARVAPWHARKMCAALQSATTSDRPILYRREANVGHAARSLTRTIELSVDTMSFHAHQLGLEL